LSTRPPLVPYTPLFRSRADQDVSIEVSAAARRWLAENGFDEKMGARPMKRIIQEHINRPLADELLFGKLADGGNVSVDVSPAGDGRALDCRSHRPSEASVADGQA